jgi:hypothetical protein
MIQEESHEESGDNTPAEKSLPQEAVEGYISIKEVYGDGGLIDQIMHSDDPPASAESGDDTSADSGSDDSGSDDSGSDDSGSDDSGE